MAFSGWEMPLAYPKGTLAEHLACRRGAVAFDVSHLGTVRLQGPGSWEVLQRTLTNDLRKVGPGHAQYSHLLTPEGFVADDVIVWWLDDECFDVMPNASNTASVVEAVGGFDATEGRAVVAIQGPEARQRLEAVAPAAAAVGRMEVGRFSFAGHHGVAAGTGYTGEDGVECSLGAEGAPAFFEALVAAGIEPAGLGARDTLRLEAGLPLHGHELGPGITPLEAGLSWVVAFDKGPFVGREALVEERRRGPRRRLQGLVAKGRRPPRQGAPILAEGVEVGRVTSGNFSPVLGQGIALGFLPGPDGLPAGQEVTIEVRGQPLTAHVTRTPFVSRSAPNQPVVSRGRRP